MTKAAYARYKGVSKPMVTKWARDGRLVMTDDGKRVKVKESDERIKSTKHLNNWANEQSAALERGEINERIKEQAQQKTVEQLETEVKQTQLDLETESASELFANARALKEKTAALQAQAEHEKFIGKLVEKEKIERLLFERGRQFRDGLLINARRISPLIVGVKDTAEIENILTKEYRQLLINFSKLPENI